ncbi:hypothetical protein A9Q84_02360 [Halobacteriovorax marinus]|uniref:BFD-like [2Fe-2S]-binding domain-containing protein n=1 Tax=Halobacteriovorax marinus TaxID=97084 RepID=A0A1Y5FCF8_9BACT|nr:hypothetical protein A9Q84_02360 [Halobacteriovorax marinus]
MSNFNQKPFLISSESAIEIGSQNYQVYLDINNRSRLEGFYFLCAKEDPWFVVFQSFALVLEGVRLEGIEQAVLSWKEGHKDILKKQFIMLPEFLLHLALDQYHGKNHDHESLSKFKSEQLICRCFGVYEQHIEEHVQSYPKATVLDIADELRATIGCGTCHSRVVEYLEKCLSKSIIENLEETDLAVEFDSDGKRIRPLGLTPSDFVLKIDQLKNKWIKDQELTRYKIEIESITGLEIDFSVEPQDNGQYIVDTLKEHIESKLNLILRFNLLD